MSVVLTNCGAEAFSVSGYPVVVLLDEEREPFEVEVVHGSEPITSGDEGWCTASGRFDDGPQDLTLAPGETAVAGVVWRNTTTDELDRLVNAPYLSVSPAEGGVAQELTQPGGIDLGTSGRLGVSAWRPPSSC